MSIHDWALVIFTILAQMSVGAFLVLGIVHYFARRKAGMEQADHLSDRALVAIIVTLGLGMLASLFHLGNPLYAPRAVTNLATSWLSREILSGVIFAVLGVAFSAMQWFKWGTFASRNIVAWLAAVAGLALVFCMSQVYMLPNQPAWNSLATPISFFATTFLLGGLALGVAFVINYAYIQNKNPGSADVQCDLLRAALKGISIASIVLVGLILVIQPLYMGYLAVGPKSAVASARLIMGAYGAFYFIRLALVFIGAGVFGAFLYITTEQAGKVRMMSYLTYGAFVLVFVAELMGRMLFYLTHRGIGL